MFPVGGDAVTVDIQKIGTRSLDSSPNGDVERGCGLPGFHKRKTLLPGLSGFARANRRRLVSTPTAPIWLKLKLNHITYRSIPDTILFLSFFYKSSELPKRLACFWISYTVTTIIGAFLAFGFLHIKDANGGGSWKYVFAFEGLITGLIGIIAYFWMPASPVQTKGGLRGKDGWFNEHEEKIMVNRVIRDDPSKGSMHNREGLNLRLFWESLKDFHMWPIYLLGLIWLIPTTPATNYLTLQLRSQGFTTFQTNLLTIPSAVIGIITLMSITWIAERTNQRLLWGAGVEVWNLVLLIALEALPQKTLPWPRWAILTLLVGSPSIHPVVVALTSRNAGSVRTRTIASALYNMSVQISNIAGANVSLLAWPFLL